MCVCMFLGVVEVGLEGTGWGALMEDASSIAVHLIS